jgi:hypothetical protein
MKAADGGEGSNTAVGYQALLNLNSDGADENTCIGNIAGTALTTGTNNTLIGSEAAASAVDADGQIVIGKSAVGLEDGTAIIGNTSCAGFYSCGGRHKMHNHVNNIANGATETFTVTGLAYGQAIIKLAGYGNGHHVNIYVILGGHMAGGATYYSNTVVANQSTANIGVTLTANQTSYTIALANTAGDAIFLGCNLESINYTGNHVAGAWS